MGDTGMTTETLSSLPCADAVERNRELMQKFESALKRNPAADLMALIPDSYRQKHQESQFKSPKTSTAMLNQRTLNVLNVFLRKDPEINLLSVFPPNYGRRYRLAAQSSINPLERKVTKPPSPPDFRTRLDTAETPTVVFPLSQNVATLLKRFCESDAQPTDAGHALLGPLRQLLWSSQKLWENPVRGVVVKCDDDLVAKVVVTSGDYTEYTTLQYLAERAPDIPVPRPHGLIRIGLLCVIFMTYIPSMTLTEAWPTLTHQDKVSVQRQLDGIFCQLRTLQKDDYYLECVEGKRVMEHTDRSILSVPPGYEDLECTTPHHGSKTYVKFLHSFLTDPDQGSVFAHGDVRTDNIIVKRDHNNACVVTGIIDWEDSGFYPKYYECTQLTGTLSLTEENDWYSYLPGSISPLRFPIHWLVHRLWYLHVQTS
ncbi:hypothetical protein Aspvir_004074 [Aspergillus viridinutans]|uniref:Aminoglycoside phosphotransferase domain-containing protein n=1 Tax=Aspergillus viridinutans TaxID=75553 RepID=A0A9P3F091_ASPVI|nr:uncharacterized protein Aspvir_004074 [Aspergillus viridinutans]GIK00059.1 hypothetical protein Aspvir_004074 [Aspergillus viridinutans]